MTTLNRRLPPLKHRLWDPKAETMSREDLEKLQLERLQATVRRVYERVPFYREKLDAAGVKPEDIRRLDDVQKLPFTCKDDLRAAYPYGLFAAPLKDIVRIHASSGTTGLSTVVGYTRRDLRIWSDLVARLLTAGGVTRHDVVHISFGYGLFTGGFGLHQGSERIGASVIPVSSGNTERQVRLMKDFGATALVGTPSYALHIAETMYEMGVSPDELSLRVGLFGAEPSSETLRREIEAKLQILATDNYGLSEVMGPGVSGECLNKSGLHINEDHFLAEIINPETGEALPEGYTGELVLTTLTKEGIPLLRYRTRDLTRLDSSPCSCGRTFRRMARVQGRTDDMMIIRGVNVFPSQIENVLLEIEGVEPHYELVLDRVGALDTLEIRVEVTPEIFEGRMAGLVELEKRIRHKVQSECGITPTVSLVEPKSIQRSQGKAKRVIDKRVF
ncbi:MAG: phenylacetate-coenzyme A ligase [Armatimonadota bacterium]|nr:MAG: phenylacetate-coenzyme A ligase [Armatimonadota bacterium]